MVAFSSDHKELLAIRLAVYTSYAHKIHRSYGFRNVLAHYLQDGCIVCPTTDSTFELKTGAIKDWYPKNPVLRVLIPALRTHFVYPAKTDEENIYISMRGSIRSDASAEIVFSGRAQPGVTASDVNVDEVRMVVDEDLEGFGFTGSVQGNGVPGLPLFCRKCCFQVNPSTHPPQDPLSSVIPVEGATPWRWALLRINSSTTTHLILTEVHDKEHHNKGSWQADRDRMHKSQRRRVCCLRPPPSPPLQSCGTKVKPWPFVFFWAPAAPCADNGTRIPYKDSILGWSPFPCPSTSVSRLLQIGNKQRS
ncbi:hypothetical protein SAY86_020852 [Trapa natans]|uniref:Uncharacterized protein n=1 Tax=Trapa natans TaxID=22666 RepID=A0AAN7MRF2_TRANT|nr:hypothetical protein SAY86_020852 [Trapa natans]